MTPRKAEIVDSLHAAGDVGLSSHELWVMHYGHMTKTKKSVVKSHMNQINDLLVETDYKIVCEGRNGNARFHLYKRGRRQR